MSTLLRPAAGWELQNMLVPLIERQLPVEIVGSGSKQSVGRPVQAEVKLTTAAMQGIWLYEPTELVMSAQAGTTLAQVEAMLASNGQMLAFEPIDLGPTTGGSRGTQTIGAVFASNASGSRRITAGAARDSLLGIEAVNGRAELFRAGGRVMKNVTGVDLCRGLAGSWGTLAVLVEVTFKVLPSPDASATLLYFGLPDDLGAEVLSAAMRLPFEVSGAVHLPENLVRRLEHDALRTHGQSITALRIENFQSAVAYREQEIRKALKVYGEPSVLRTADTISFWGELRYLSILPYSRETCLWRVSTTPTRGPKVVSAIKRHMRAEVYYDWAGGLIWIEVPASADAGASDIRRAVAVHGGHATLIRAEPEVRTAVEVFQPQAPALERLMRGLKDAFDPYRVLNPGRMYATF